MGQIEDAYRQVQRFKGRGLRTRIAELEQVLCGGTRQACAALYSAQDIDRSLLLAALVLKRASSQIDEVVHALGILLVLPHILRDDEVIDYVSLGAGNTGRPFDLETNLRIAEFKFTDWKGGPEAIRQNQLFKDFYLLAEHDTPKSRFLYFVNATAPMKFFNGRRALSSVMSRGNKLWATFQQQYGTRFATVRDYYDYRQSRVQLVDLATVVPLFTDTHDLISD